MNSERDKSVDSSSDSDRQFVQQALLQPAGGGAVLAAPAGPVTTYTEQHHCHHDHCHHDHCHHDHH